MIEVDYINDYYLEKRKSEIKKILRMIKFCYLMLCVMQPTLAWAGFRWFLLPTFSECSADEICSGFIAAAGPIDVRVRLVDIRVERVENVGKNRNGWARGVDVRKGKLLAGDSGRKIAEVIDLRRAIYQRGSREDGRGTLASIFMYIYRSMPVCE